MIIVIIIFILFIIYFHLTINNKNCKKKEKFSINNDIPKVIYICYKTKNIPNYIIPNIKKLYPDYEIKLYDDNDCIKFLKDNYGQLYVDIFNFLKDGPIKSDFWRICVLYKYGGIYFDLDVEHFKNLNEIIDNDTDFVTIKTNNLYKKTVNPAIIITKSNNYIIKNCIDIYLEKYRNNIPYEYWTYSITDIMFKILNNKLKTELNKDGIYYDNYNNKYQFIIEQVPSINDAYFEYNGIKIANTRYNKYNSDNHTFE